MKPVTLLIVAAALCGPNVVDAQGFEGTIVGVLSTGKMQIETSQHMRGRMVRRDMNMAGNNVSVITDGESGKMILLNHPQKMWIDMASMNQMMARMGRGAKETEDAPKEMPPIERTDRVETIAGHECRHYLINIQGGNVDLCAATGMGIMMPGGVPSMGMGRPQGPSMPALPNADVWMRAFKDGFFVLKMDATSKDGTMSWLVKSVEKKSVPEDQFKPPATYNEMKMPGGR